MSMSTACFDYCFRDDVMSMKEQQQWLVMLMRIFLAIAAEKVHIAITGKGGIVVMCPMSESLAMTFTSLDYNTLHASCGAHAPEA